MATYRHTLGWPPKKEGFANCGSSGRPAHQSSVSSAAAKFVKEIETKIDRSLGQTVYEAVPPAEHDFVACLPSIQTGLISGIAVDLSDLWEVSDLKSTSAAFRSC